MGKLMQVVGGFWAIIGVANVVLMFSHPENSALAPFALILNMILFILPGLVVLGIGSFLSRKTSSPNE